MMHIPKKFKWRVRINTILLLVLIATVVYLLTKPINVLTDWKVSVTKKDTLQLQLRPAGG